ncbi:MAG: hypothetical protein KAX99_06465 [Azonexus sp.]|nr:hypothetical protein [Azonexus sp.]
MEVVVIKPFMFAGKPQPAGSIIDMPTADAHYAIGLKRAEAGDVIDLPVADAAYVIGLRRAQKVEAADKPAEAKPKKPAKK